MPTANSVDNRPVALGKWPRYNNHHHNHHPVGMDRFAHRHRRKCDVVENCTHNHSNPCTDVLLNPELLNQIHGDQNFLKSSSNPLLEFCLDGGKLKSFDLVDVEELDPLLQVCLDFTNSPLTTDLKKTLEHLSQIGCDINVQNSKGNTALHILLKGCNKDYFKVVLESTNILLAMGLDTSIQNHDGDDCLISLANLLDQGLFSECFDLATILLEDPHCNPNRLNKTDRSLLAYSVIHGDESIDLTRLLFNHGAKVRPIRYSPITTAQEVIEERAASAFTHFLRSAIQRRDLNMFWETLRLICIDMGNEPEAMRSHVLSTMVHTGQAIHGATSPSIANLFLQLKSYMSHYWRQPLSLSYLCVNRIRGSLGPNNILKGTDQLKIPPSLICKIHLK